MDDYYAHTKNVAGQRHLLREHLVRVAEQTAEFAKPLGVESLGYLAGVLHDIGKIQPKFQEYLLAVEQDKSLKGKGPSHKRAGAVHAFNQRLEFLAFLVAGHHGGLPSRQGLKPRLRKWTGDPEVHESIRLATVLLPELSSLTGDVPTFLSTPYDPDLFLRLLFSALVDADFLDTEHHFASRKSTLRRMEVLWSNLWTQFESSQSQYSVLSHVSFTEQQETLFESRKQIYEECLRAAEDIPGFFRLTVPTGGGKTRSSLAFALRHALRHGMSRIIYAIPYMSITEQTADVFRSIFPQTGTVLEHHSGIELPDDPTSLTEQQVWSRLAAENWDASVIVTTTVQLFESLLACSTSACRKLHNIAGSVLILDEAQMLPTNVLETILDVLKQLVQHYGVTVVLCTATQPALDQYLGFKELAGIREIIQAPELHFQALSRVEYRWPVPGETWTWEQVAARARQSEQTLIIVNTRDDARKLVQALDDPRALHLSTSMCGAHRRVVLKEVRHRLDRREPCRLVSTQLIEAGVDVDFPLVLRAMGPFDSIAQAAGRCNREGKLPQKGTVVVFLPKEGGLPPGPYRIGTQRTEALLKAGPIDTTDLETYRRYFESYYRSVDMDEYNVQVARRMLDFPEVENRFRMIEEDSVSVVVHYQHPERPTEVANLLNDLQQRQGNARDIVRKLQQYTVSIRHSALQQIRDRQLPDRPDVVEIAPDLWEWKSEYDQMYGLILKKV